VRYEEIKAAAIAAALHERGEHLERIPAAMLPALARALDGRGATLLADQVREYLKARGGGNVRRRQRALYGAPTPALDDVGAELGVIPAADEVELRKDNKQLFIQRYGSTLQVFAEDGPWTKL